MKTNYFTHRLFPVDEATVCESLKTTIDTMIKDGTNSTTISGEHYVIQHLLKDVYIFIKTNSKDVFRKLDVSSNTCVDLSNILNKNEKIAFASFFIIKDNLVGFSNTLHSPRINKLAEMYDTVMFSRNSNHNIKFQPITKDVTEQELLSYAHVGKITMKIEKNQSFVSGLSTFFTGNVDYDDVDSFEIKIIPKRSKDIKDTFSGIMNNLPQEVRSIAVSAKEHLGDVATDINVIASNTVSDIITDNALIASQMEDNYNNNTVLRSLGF
ncbi:hypothetical protein [Xenorhabdus sp. SGI240]|uniref:hypothetical protein n=1 Tax=Xenorhabdus sp. SGI240 TaxID=3158262 RepID=UPI0032B777BE